MSNEFTMVGTEGTGAYVGVATNSAQVGFRKLPGNQYRVRVEPVAGNEETLKAIFTGWKAGMGGAQYRFSKVVTGFDALCDAVVQALQAVLPEGEVCHVSVDCPPWVTEWAAVKAAEEIERQQLIAQVKAAKLPGCNFAKRWSTDTLRRKLLQAE